VQVDENTPASPSKLTVIPFTFAPDELRFSLPVRNLVSFFKSERQNFR